MNNHAVNIIKGISLTDRLAKWLATLDIYCVLFLAPSLASTPVDGKERDKFVLV